MSTTSTSASAKIMTNDGITVPVKRRWFRVSTDENNNASQSQEFPFTIMSYNILAQALVRRDMFPYCSKNSLRLAFRRENLLREMIASSVDIICLQEVDRDLYFSFWDKRLNAQGYASEWGEKSGGAKHGCAIFYRRNKFTKHSYQTVQYSDIAEEYKKEEQARIHAASASSSSSAAASSASTSTSTVASTATSTSSSPSTSSSTDTASSSIPIDESESSIYAELNRGNIAQLLALAPIVDGEEMKSAGIIVTNTHLFWNPIYVYVRLRQTHMLLRELVRMNANLHFCPILCGDFNITPDNLIYSYLTHRTLPSSEWSWFLPPPGHGDQSLHHAGSMDASFTKIAEKLKAIDLSDEKYYQRWGHVQTLLEESAHLPLLQSVYSNYTNVVPDDIRESVKKSSDSDYCLWTGEPPFTTYTEKWKGTLDYIFTVRAEAPDSIPQPTSVTSTTSLPSHVITHFPNQFTPSPHSTYTLDTHSILELPQESVVSKSVGLPDDTFSSDHISIAAKMVLRRKKE